VYEILKVNKGPYCLQSLYKDVGLHEFLCEPCLAQGPCFAYPWSGETNGNEENMLRVANLSWDADLSTYQIKSSRSLLKYGFPELFKIMGGCAKFSRESYI
jgi:hypothetical protein